MEKRSHTQELEAVREHFRTTGGVAPVPTNNLAITGNGDTDRELLKDMLSMLRTHSPNCTPELAAQLARGLVCLKGHGVRSGMIKAFCAMTIHNDRGHYAKPSEYTQDAQYYLDLAEEIYDRTKLYGCGNETLFRYVSLLEMKKGVGHAKQSGQIADCSYLDRVIAWVESSALVDLQNLEPIGLKNLTIIKVLDQRRSPTRRYIVTKYRGSRHPVSEYPCGEDGVGECFDEVLRHCKNHWSIMGGAFAECERCLMNLDVEKAGEDASKWMIGITGIATVWVCYEVNDDDCGSPRKGCDYDGRVSGILDWLRRNGCYCWAVGHDIKKDLDCIVKRYYGVVSSDEVRKFDMVLVDSAMAINLMIFYGSPQTGMGPFSLSATGKSQEKGVTSQLFCVSTTTRWDDCGTDNSWDWRIPRWLRERICRIVWSYLSGDALIPAAIFALYFYFKLYVDLGPAPSAEDLKLAVDIYIALYEDLEMWPGRPEMFIGVDSIENDWSGRFGSLEELNNVTDLCVGKFEFGMSTRKLRGEDSSVLQRRIGMFGTEGNMHLHGLSGATFGEYIECVNAQRHPRSIGIEVQLRQDKLPHSPPIPTPNGSEILANRDGNLYEHTRNTGGSGLSYDMTLDEEMVVAKRGSIFTPQVSDDSTDEEELLEARSDDDEDENMGQILEHLLDVDDSTWTPEAPTPASQDMMHRVTEAVKSQGMQDLSSTELVQIWKHDTHTNIRSGDCNRIAKSCQALTLDRLRILQDQDAMVTILASRFLWDNLGSVMVVAVKYQLTDEQMTGLLLAQTFIDTVNTWHNGVPIIYAAMEMVIRAAMDVAGVETTAAAKEIMELLCGSRRFRFAYNIHTRYAGDRSTRDSLTKQLGLVTILKLGEARKHLRGFEKELTAAHRETSQWEAVGKMFAKPAKRIRHNHGTLRRRKHVHLYMPKNTYCASRLIYYLARGSLELYNSGCSGYSREKHKKVMRLVESCLTDITPDYPLGVKHINDLELEWRRVRDKLVENFNWSFNLGDGDLVSLGGAVSNGAFQQLATREAKLLNTYCENLWTRTRILSNMFSEVYIKKRTHKKPKRSRKCTYS